MKYILLLLVVSLFGCKHYSDGSRVGTIIKFSKKGAMCKTWEGELLTGSVKSNRFEYGDTKIGTASNSFVFSVDDKDIAATISSAMDQDVPVRLYYHEEKWTITVCRGDTNYFVDSVKIIHQ